jgi:hypothetical protein
MKPEELERESELNRIVALLEQGEMNADIADDVIRYFEGLSELKTELLEIDNAIEVIRDKTKPNRFVDYKAGWYQDLKGNLYKYDGVVWDVVPGRDTKVEFLG